MLRTLGLQVFRGFCMGSADVVPGVSGGTIALVFGIYAELIAQVRRGARLLGRAAKGDLAGVRDGLRELDWAFLLPLLVGILAAVVTLAGVIEHALEEEPVRTAAVFFGLVMGSIVVTARHLGRLDARRLTTLALVALATFVVLGFRSDAADDPALVFVFAGGAIAICAMILPGISGSFLLLMLGLYDFVLGAVNDRDLVVAVVFGLGAVLGLAFFSTLLGWALDNHEHVLMAGLVGLMVGSLRVLWPWPEGTGGTELAAPTGGVLVPVCLAVLGLAVVVVIARIAREREDATEDVRTLDPG